MSESHRWTAGSPRRTFLKTAAGLAAGTVLAPGAQWAQSGEAGGSAFPKINPRFMIAPDQAWDWNAFKSRGGPTYAGSAGWKRYTDFLISKLHEFGGVDFDYVEIPYDHHIVDDWPDRRTHVFDSGIAVEKLVIRWDARSGSRVLWHDVRLHAAGGRDRADAALRSREAAFALKRSKARFWSSRRLLIPMLPTPIRFWTISL